MSVEKRNIFLQEVFSYVSGSGRAGIKFPKRTNQRAHADYIRQELDKCKQQDLTQKQVAAIRHKEGIYLEFSGAAGYDLCTKSLENYSSGIRLLNVREENGTVKATVYVPENKAGYFIDKVQAYAESLDGIEENKNPKNNDLVRSIEDVKVALLEAFWVGKT